MAKQARFEVRRSLDDASIVCSPIGLPLPLLLSDARNWAAPLPIISLPAHIVSAIETSGFYIIPDPGLSSPATAKKYGA